MDVDRGPRRKPLYGLLRKLYGRCECLGMIALTFSYASRVCVCIASSSTPTRMASAFRPQGPDQNEQQHTTSSQLQHTAQVDYVTRLPTQGYKFAAPVFFFPH